MSIFDGDDARANFPCGKDVQEKKHVYVLMIDNELFAVVDDRQKALSQVVKWMADQNDGYDFRDEDEPMGLLEYDECVVCNNYHDVDVQLIPMEVV